MTCNTSNHKVSVNPPFDQFITSFFNTAIGDVITTPPAKRHITKPATNVLHQEDKYQLEIALPGISKSEIDIQVEEDVLTITDKRDEAATDTNTVYRLREFNYTGFSKSYRLPEDIDPEKIEAAFKDGILHITLPKLEEAIPAGPKSIEVQ